MNTKAFTLIELLVVVLIIGILSAIALPQYQKAVMKTRFATMKDVVNSIYQAEQIYYLANGEYTTDFDNLDIDVGKEGTSNNERILPWGTCILESGYHYCYHNAIKMAYYINPSTKIHYCLTNNPNTITHRLQHELCQQETGKTAADMNEYGSYAY